MTMEPTAKGRPKPGKAKKESYCVNASGGQKSRFSVITQGLASTLLVLGLAHVTDGNAAPGDIDPTFNAPNKGKQLSGTPGRDRAFGVTSLSDGSVIAVGQFGRDIGISRYRPNGSLDKTFSPQRLGEQAARESAHSVFATTNGQLIITGTSETPAAVSLLFKRVQPNAQVTEVGSRIFNPSTSAGSFASALQSDGKLLSAGYVGASGSADFLIVRVDPETANFASDTSFDGDGVVTTDLGGNDIAYGIAVQPDGKIIAVGESNARGNKDFAVVRYNSNGSLDTSFGTNGIVLTEFSNLADEAESVAVQADGKILVAGSTVSATNDNDIALVRYSTGGTLDPTFAIGGYSIVDLRGKDEKAFSVQALGSGKIVTVGYSNAFVDRDFTILRYTRNGKLDGTFGVGGSVLVDFGKKNDTAYAQTVQADGKLVVVGTSDSFDAGDFAVTKLLDVDPPRCSRPTIVGTEGNDVLRGTPGPDVIVGLGGDDDISGLGGDDLICGGEGNDTLRGNAGRDRLLGEGGDDQLLGQSGNDTLTGGPGNNRLNGGSGTDTCRQGQAVGCE